MQVRHTLLIAGVAVALAGACNRQSAGEDDRVARAALQAAPGSNVAGTVELEQLQDGVRIRADLRGLPPGPHGFHIHEQGTCTPPDFESAGGHFAPEGEPHGAPGAAQRHAGDLGNIVADAEGNATLDVTTDQLTLADGAHSAVGRAVVVHAKADDFQSQPSGDAGGRIACGVIERPGERPGA